jgi:hypothetical protein
MVPRTIAHLAVGAALPALQRQPGVAGAQRVLERVRGVGGQAPLHRHARVGLPAGEDLVARAAGGGEHEVRAPAREVVVEQVAGHARRRADLLHQAAVDAVLGDRAHRRAHELLPPRLARHPLRRAGWVGHPPQAT